MDFIQNEINYNLIILYIEYFIQYELELGKGFSMSEKHELLELIEEYKNNHYGKEWCVSKYQFKPLQDISAKKGKVREKRNGFLVYSSETIDNTKNTKLSELYKKSSIQKIKEKNIYRYFYYEQLEIKNKKSQQAIIVMMNPAYADSEKPDSTIKNVKKFLENNKDFSSFEILNLYPIRMPKSQNLSSFLNGSKEEKENYQNIVKDYLNDTQKTIIVAWGAKLIDNKEAMKIFKNLKKKLFCYDTTINGYPRHFSPLSYPHSIKIKNNNYDLIPYTDLDA